MSLVANFATRLYIRSGCLFLLYQSTSRSRRQLHVMIGSLRTRPNRICLLIASSVRAPVPAPAPALEPAPANSTSQQQQPVDTRMRSPLAKQLHHHAPPPPLSLRIERELVNCLPPTVIDPSTRAPQFCRPALLVCSFCACDDDVGGDYFWPNADTSSPMEALAMSKLDRWPSLLGALAAVAQASSWLSSTYSFGASKNRRPLG